MLTEDSIVTKIVVLAEGLVVHRADRVLRDGVVIASSERSHEYSPGQDVSGEGEAVARIAFAAWPPEVVKAYADRMAAERQAAIAAYDAQVAAQAVVEG